MPFDASKLGEVVGNVLGNHPHPDVPELKVNQYAAFARVAARMFGSATPEPRHVQQAYHTLTAIEVSPAEFERVWDVARPLANSLLGRDPSTHDLMSLVHAQPADIQSFYMGHPHPDAPDVPAGQMAAYHAHAAPIAHRTVGRDPNTVELRRFALGNYTTGDMVAHYTDDGSAPGDGNASG